MRTFDWTKEFYYYEIDGKRYVYIFPNPEFNEHSNGYYGVATVWREDDTDNKFTVPYYTKYDEVDLTTNVIRDGIKAYVEANS